VQNYAGSHWILPGCQDSAGEAEKSGKIFSQHLSRRKRGEKKRRMNTDLRYHFFSERVISWWNKLDSTTICVTTINSFKNRLQKLWLKDEFVFGR